MARKKYKEKTLKKLFALSGNICAFPNCNENIVDSAGNILGEICHIEAASPGGERYNKNQTQDDRCAFKNLILFCRKHHVITDDEQKYTVKKLQEIKKEHEEKFMNNQYNLSDEAFVVLNSKINELYEYYKLESSTQLDFGIISDIYKYLLENKIRKNNIESIKDSDQLTSLKEKVALNFSTKQIKTINDMLLNNWDRKQSVAEFIKIETEKDPNAVNALIDMIQTDFRKIKNVEYHYEKIEKLNIIDELALKYLPISKTRNPDYVANAKAMVLYFFEYCYFGKKTNKEEYEQVNLLF